MPPDRMRRADALRSDSTAIAPLNVKALTTSLPTIGKVTPVATRTSTRSRQLHWPLPKQWPKPRTRSSRAVTQSWDPSSVTGAWLGARWNAAGEAPVCLAAGARLEAPHPAGQYQATRKHGLNANEMMVASAQYHA